MEGRHPRQLLPLAVVAALSLVIVAAGYPVGWIGLLAAGFLLVWFTLLNRRQQGPLVWKVRTDATSVGCEYPGGKVSSLPWDDLQQVLLVTTADGPWYPDAWLVFHAPPQEFSLPTEAEGFDELLGVLEKRLPGFDFQAVIDAAGSTEQAVFQCWQREPSEMEP